MKKANTLQQLERTEAGESSNEADGTSQNEAGDGGATIVRDEAWIDRFDTEATDELYAKATRYASSRATQIERAGGSADDDYIHDVVQGAFADTYTGTLTWDPSKASLEAHVIQTIKSRTRHDRDHIGERRRHVSFDIHDQTRASATTRASVEASLAANSEVNDDALETATRAVDSLRQIATDERADDVLVLIDAYEGGAYTRAEVLATTSLTPQRYRNARARLATFTKRLPADIHRAARFRS
jgi:hypothetical protein